MNRLVIIRNGFYIAHGLKTCYVGLTTGTEICDNTTKGITKGYYSITKEPWCITKGDYLYGIQSQFTEMVESLGIDRRNIQTNIKKLQELELIRREGGHKDGKWVESLLWGLLV